MVLMTKFDKSLGTNHQIYILKEELSSLLSLDTWLEQINACFEGYTTS